MSRYIGNVVVQSPNMKVETYFKKCNSIDDIDNNLPTLIVGYNLAKSVVPSFDILKNVSEDKRLWWTFTKTERRVTYDDVYESFVRYCVNEVVSGVDYKCINILNHLRYNAVKRILRFIGSECSKLIYNFDNKFLFVYTSTAKAVYGFSLSTCDYLGVSVEHIARSVFRNPSNRQLKYFGMIPNDLRKYVLNDTIAQIVLADMFSN